MLKQSSAAIAQTQAWVWVHQRVKASASRSEEQMKKWSLQIYSNPSKSKQQ
jgi:hypothetical protein